MGILKTIGSRQLIMQIVQLVQRGGIMTMMSSSDAREHFPELVNEAAFAKNSLLLFL